MSLPTRHVGVSLGQLAHFNDGLGEFSRQLCTRFAAVAPRLKAEHGIELWVHMNDNLLGSFGNALHYLPALRAQRKEFKAPVRFELWHSLHQLNRLLAPVGTGHRLVTVHDLNFLYFKGLYSRLRDMYRMRKLMARTDEVVTITDYVRQDVQRHLGWRGPIQVVHNGVTDLSGHPQAPVELPPMDGGYLFHLSRMAPSKNVAAIVGLAAHWPGQHFVFAGPRSDDSQALAADVQRRGLENVTMLNNVSNAQKAWLLAHCQGLVFPSFTEGFGLPVIEAMYFGKPVFLSRLTALPEVGGDAACYFDSFDPPSMKRTIEDGLRRHAQSGGEQACVTWARGFSWERCATQYLNIYLRVLGLPALAG